MRLAIIAAAMIASITPAFATDDYVAQIKGDYDLWEDFEGGTVCPLRLMDERVVGGFALEGDNACMQVFGFDDDPYAWSIDTEGWLVLAGGARQVLVRLRDEGDATFYADRAADAMENINLTLAD